MISGIKRRWHPLKQYVVINELPITIIQESRYTQTWLITKNVGKKSNHVQKKTNVAVDSYQKAATEKLYYMVTLIWLSIPSQKMTTHKHDISLRS